MSHSLMNFLSNSPPKVTPSNKLTVAMRPKIANRLTIRISPILLLRLLLLRLLPETTTEFQQA
ncbi:MAG: hypothetical protein HC840_11500 [Leptolyngbyaceae cyanobacterium RM2_2_4]|nr:hypothetical protein [Leptolyngbyaceae cyanobacterium RM2_2_4]